MRNSNTQFSHDGRLCWVAQNAFLVLVCSLGYVFAISMSFCCTICWQSFEIRRWTDRIPFDDNKFELRYIPTWFILVFLLFLRNYCDFLHAVLVEVRRHGFSWMIKHVGIDDNLLSFSASLFVSKLLSCILCLRKVWTAESVRTKFISFDLSTIHFLELLCIAIGCWCHSNQ